jgi:monoamine oxidase
VSANVVSRREFLTALAAADTLAAVDGRIHFAGEHTSPWTGWMQGALESARRVVAEINR